MKKILSVMLAAMMGVSLMGCSGGSASTETLASSAGTEQASESSQETQAASEGESMELKLATDAAEDYPTTMALISFADEVREKTNGRINIVVYPSSQLGDETAYMEQLTFGAVDIAKLSIGTISSLCKDLQVFGLPYIFKNSDEMWQVLESDIGTDMLKELNEYNIQGIGYTDCGSRCFYTTEPVQKLEDLKGMKIRVQSNDLMLAMTDALGCNSVNVAANEVYSAVQTGVVQGGENNANIYLSDSLYEVAPYYILDNHIISPDVICVNLDVWNSLSAEDQAIFNEAMANATAYQRQLWNEAVDQSLEKVKEGGATVFEPDEATLQEFQDAMAPVYEKYGTELQDWIDRINTELGNE